MLSRVKRYMRGRLRAMRDADACPVLLPHHRVVEGGLQTLEREPRPLDASVLAAARLCDGSRTLSEICGVTKARCSALHELLDQELLLLWRSRVSAALAEVADARNIVVSPHPDDAPLCVGGIMLQSPPLRTIVMDVFMRTAWSRFPSELNDVARIADIRLAEERLMARLAGAMLVSLDLPEAILRQHMFENVFSDAPSTWDQDVRTAVQMHAKLLACKHAGATWYLPLAVGNHLDHRIVRDAALRALQATGVGRKQILFYEDLPYAEKLGGVPDFSDALPGTKLSPRTIDIEPVMRWKLEMSRAYWSQFSWSQLMKLRDYARRIGGGRAVERVWEMASGGLRIAE